MTLRLQSLTTGYRRGASVLQGVSAEFPAGAVTAVIGLNGAGKTTLLRAALGLLDAWSGSATIAGRATAALSPRERAAALAYAPQRPTIVGAFTARRVVALGRIALRARPDLIDRALDAVGLADKADEPFASLSAGQQQRAALARSLAQLDIWSPAPGPRALCTDEPFASLDPAHALRVIDLLRTAAGSGVAVVLATHDLTAARRCADRALALAADGRALAAGEAHHVLDPAVLAGVLGVEFHAAGTPGGVALTPVRPL